MQQGAQRYKADDDQKGVKPVIEAVDKDHEHFEFDSNVPGLQRFLEYREQVMANCMPSSGRKEPNNTQSVATESELLSKTSKPSTEVQQKQSKNDLRRMHLQKQASKFQKGRHFPSEETRRLDHLFKEVGIQNSNLGMTLVQTREKLKPFVDDGVVHKDRKRQIKKPNDDIINQKKNAELEERVCDFKV